MLGLDINVLARIVLRDDAVQTPAALKRVARAIAQGMTVVAGLPTLLELDWVMRSYGKLTKLERLHIFTQLLETKDLRIDGEAVLEVALHQWENSDADFADCLFLAQYQRMGCDTMLTFDAKAARMTGVELVAG